MYNRSVWYILFWYRCYIYLLYIKEKDFSIYLRVPCSQEPSVKVIKMSSRLLRHAALVISQSLSYVTPSDPHTGLTMLLGQSESQPGWGSRLRSSLHTAFSYSTSWQGSKNKTYMIKEIIIRLVSKVFKGIQNDNKGWLKKSAKMLSYYSLPF